jgi:hypothetical protein
VDVSFLGLDVLLEGVSDFLSVLEEDEGSFLSPEDPESVDPDPEDPEPEDPEPLPFLASVE